MSTSTASVSVVSAHKPLGSLPQEPAPNPTSQRLEQAYDTYDDSTLSYGPYDPLELLYLVYLADFEVGTLRQHL